MLRSGALSRSIDSPPPDLLRLFEPIRDDLVKVEREFGRHLQSQVALIPKIGKYIQTSGGKRVRPAVLIMAARLCGYQGERAVLHAAVVEFIHTATLVHDDIIDDSKFRRGRLAVHSQWGNDITVLLGDFLYIKSMSLALSQDSLDIVRLLCDVTLRMIEGELYQLTKNGDIAITEDEHFDIIRRKTAYLFAGCAQIGGMLGTCTLEQQGALREYGFNLGIAFQLMDDLLDFTGDAAALGKPVGGDLREGKVTLPIIRLLAGADAATRALVAGVVEGRDVTLERWADITRLLRQSGALDYATQRAGEYAVAARQKLAAFPDGPERDALAALADFVLLRDR
jgi:octaprenyl-diphosphate synthase